MCNQTEMKVEHIIFIRQTVDNDYFTMIVDGKLNHATAMETIIDEISIKDHAGQYTPDFINLLKDYYLYM